MGASNHPGLKFHKPLPAVLTKLDKRRTKDAALRAAYDQVDARDGGICWVTGVTTTPCHRDPKRRREHHHLIGRIGDRRADVHHLITVSAYAHQLLTTHVLLTVGSDARRAIRFKWNTALLDGRPAPFRLRRQITESAA